MQFIVLSFTFTGYSAESNREKKIVAVDIFADENLLFIRYTMHIHVCGGDVFENGGEK